MIFLLCAAVGASAATLRGVVTNGTSGKPSAGDKVTLISLSQAMNEAAHATTDAQGRFKLDFTDDGTPHLVRVTHQEVNYFSQGGPVAPGTESVNVQVYDSAAKVAGVSTKIRAMRLQGNPDSLEVLELFAVNNESSPPRSVISDRTYEISLPDGAQVDQAAVSSAGGMPVNTMPASAGNGKYYFQFPLRPGETRFQVAYHLPYNGKAEIHPHVDSNLEHFAVLLPKSMQFEGDAPQTYSSMGDQSGQSQIQVATGVKPGENIGFRVSGTGVLKDTPETASSEGGGEQQEGAAPAARDSRPGGGLGNPEGTPDALAKYRWIILGGLSAALLIGGVVIARRGRNGAASRSSGAEAVLAAAPPQSVQRASKSSKAAGDLSAAAIMDVLKDELFQLETDRQQGRVSEEEYLKSKSALDATLRRAISRRKA